MQKRSVIFIIIFIIVLVSCNNLQNGTKETNTFDLLIEDGQAIISGNLNTINSKEDFLQIASDIARKLDMKEGEEISLDFLFSKARSVIDVPPEIHRFVPTGTEKLTPHSVTILNTTWECQRTLWTYCCATCGEVYYIVSHSVSHF